METLSHAFRIALARVLDPEIERAPNEAKLSFDLCKGMVDQVRAGVKPWDVKPIPGISNERSRELLEGTGIHSALKREWERQQDGLAQVSRTPYNGRNPSLPEPHWWLFLR
jgi:hypothetical protein